MSSRDGSKPRNPMKLWQGVFIHLNLTPTPLQNLNGLEEFLPSSSFHREAIYPSDFRTCPDTHQKGFCAVKYCIHFRKTLLTQAHVYSSVMQLVHQGLLTCLSWWVDGLRSNLIGFLTCLITSKNTMSFVRMILMFSLGYCWDKNYNLKRNAFLEWTRQLTDRGLLIAHNRIIINSWITLIASWTWR